MNKPSVFPKSFYKHCPKVQEAKYYHKIFEAKDEFIEEDWAECAFVNAGFGKECENCGKFLTRPFNGYTVDEEFLPLIEKFYKEMEEWENRPEEDEVCLELNIDTDELTGLIIALRWIESSDNAKQQIGSKFRKNFLLC